MSIGPRLIELYELPLAGLPEAVCSLGVRGWGGMESRRGVGTEMAT